MYKERKIMSTLSELSGTFSSDLEDKINLLLLKNLISGESVSVNISMLAKKLQKHRNTIRKEVLQFLEYKVITKPVCPFIGLFREYPLLVVLRAHLPEDVRVHKWIAQDKHIFAGYRSRRDRYNLLLFVFQKDVTDYQLWREALTEDGMILPKEMRFPSYSSYYSNQLIIKYDPSATIDLMEGEMKREGWIEINGLVFNKFQFQILKHLVSGGVFKLNENVLSRELGLNRRTVMRRIDNLMKNGWILDPVCRFPDLLYPPNYILSYSLFEIQKNRNQIILALQSDPHVTMALRISSGGYNLLLFSSHRNIDEHQEWEEKLSKRYPECIRHMDITYLSPNSKIIVKQPQMSLSIIEDKLRS
jgi:hypothetical protein